jgi:hypothetical protein
MEDERVVGVHRSRDPLAPAVAAVAAEVAQGLGLQERGDVILNPSHRIGQ